MNKPRWQRRKDDRPAEILEAALDVFAARGFAATKLEEVAARAGVSKGTLYLYFESKEDLFRSLVRDLLLPNIAMAEQRLASDSGPAGDLLKGLAKVIGGRLAGSKLGAIPKLIMAEAANFPDLAKFYYEEVIQRGIRTIDEILKRGVANGEFRKVPTEEFFPLLIGPFLLLAIWKHGFERAGVPPIPVESVLDRHVEFLLRALAPEPAAQSQSPPQSRSRAPKTRKETKHER
jgi:AcrR family transcriptional regulator